MRKSKFVPILILLLLGATGCASITAQRVTQDDMTTKGIRYWLAAPYLLVRAPVEVKRTEELYRLDKKRDLEDDCKVDCQTLIITPLSANRSSAAQASLSVREIPAGIVLAALTSQPASSLPPPPAPKAAKKAGSGDTGQGGGAGSDTVAKAGSKKADKNTQPDTSSPSPKADASQAPSEPVSVIWLPDYCEQFALQQTNVLSSSKLKVDLGDGWKLSSFDSSQDSTVLAGKVLDLVGGALGVSKGASGGTTGTAQASSGFNVIRKVTITYLKPGLYPLVVPDSTNPDRCKAPRTISLAKLETEESTNWSVFGK